MRVAHNAAMKSNRLGGLALPKPLMFNADMVQFELDYAEAWYTSLKQTLEHLLLF